jgi:hypothetical protein
LERYRLTLQDSGYINTTDYTPQNIFEWTANIENKLKKTKKFQDLWSELARAITC